MGKPVRRARLKTSLKMYEALNPLWANVIVFGLNPFLCEDPYADMGRIWINKKKQESEMYSALNIEVKFIQSKPIRNKTF